MRAEDGLYTLHPSGIEESRKTVRHHTSGKLVVVCLEIGGDLLRIARGDSMQNLPIGLKSLAFVQTYIGIDLKQRGFYLIPERIFVFRIYRPGILLDSKLFPIERGLQFLF